MPTRLIGAVIAALCLIVPAHAEGASALDVTRALRPPVFLKLVGCGYALSRTCYVDPADYGEPRTAAGCRAAAIRALGVTDGPKAECVEMGGKR